GGGGGHEVGAAGGGGGGGGGGSELVGRMGTTGRAPKPDAADHDPAGHGARPCEPEPSGLRQPGEPPRRCGRFRPAGFCPPPLQHVRTIAHKRSPEHLCAVAWTLLGGKGELTERSGPRVPGRGTLVVPSVIQGARRWHFSRCGACTG